MVLTPKSKTNKLPIKKGENEIRKIRETNNKRMRRRTNLKKKKRKVRK